jgi:hypothetical protein
VKAVDTSACVTVNCELWKSVIRLYLNVINRDCNQSANKSNHPKYNPSFSSLVPPTRDSIMKKCFEFWS